MDLAALLQTHGYWVLAIGCLLEGETVLLLAAFAAHRGHLDMGSVLAVAAVAGFVGDEAAFWLGRRHGAHLLQRWPALAAQSGRLERLMERWHEVAIVGVRFAYGLRLAGPVLMGMSTLPAWRFAAFNALGAVLWAGVVGGLGWAFGEAAERLLGRAQHLEIALLASLAVAGAAWWWWRHRQRQR